MESLIPRAFSAPKGSFFLLGPRGTGKSTWLRERYPDAIWVDLLSPDTLRRMSAYPERLEELVRGAPDARVVIIDEVQKIPPILDVVHALIEKHKGVQFVLTGSSARKLRRVGTDLLAGRAVQCALYPFIASELGTRFSLDTALRYGMVPLVWSAEDRERTLQTYVSMYIHEEVRIEGLSRNIGDFARFLEAISFSHGSLLNMSNVARESEVGRKTVEGYVTVLEDLMVAYRIPVFAKRARRAVVTHEKFYFFDSGVFRTVRPKGPLDHPEEIEGVALEGLVAQHLVAYTAYRGGRDKLYYWRTRAGTEVDFVIYGEDTFCAIEVKNATRVHDADLASLCRFREEYPESKAVLLYRGTETLERNGVRCVPVEKFLCALRPAEGLQV